MPRTSQSRSIPLARATRSPAELRPGGRIGSWELVRLVGEGPLSRVFQARPSAKVAGTLRVPSANSSANSSAEPPVKPAGYAIKVLRPSWENDPRGLEMLRREAQIARKVSDPHLAPILSSRLHEPPYLVVMPFLQGRTLAERLSAGQLLAIPTALWIARQAAEGLLALHAAGWTHGDIKPSNLFVSPQGHVTLIDLGFAQREGQASCAADRPVLGTPNYLAPETLTSTLRTDIRSDIYSLGVVLFEMLAGRLPFLGHDAAELAELHRQGVPVDVRVLAPHVPLRAARLVHQMLAKEPLRRPQTPADLVARLAELEIETFAER